MNQLNIVSLKIKNFLSLVDVEIKPGKVTQIVGDNGDGKTSILKALDFAVQGSNDPSLVRLGEDSTEVLVELSDNTIIRRRLNSEGRQNVDVSRDGMKATSPQALLGVLFDQSSFNPLELLDPKKRHDAIMASIDLKMDPKTLAAAIGVEEKDLPPLDYTQHGLRVLDQCHRYFYQRRAEANKDAADKKKRWQTYKADFKGVDAPKMQRKEVELRRQSCHTVIAQMDNHIKRIKDSHEVNRKNGEKLQKYTEEQTKIATRIEALKNTEASLEAETEKKVVEMRRELEEQIQKLWADTNRKQAEVKKDLAAETARLETSEQFVKEARESYHTEMEGDAGFVEEKLAAEKELAQLELADKEIDAAEATERSKKMIDDMESEFQSAEAFAEAIDMRVTALGGKVKKDLMTAAEMPVAGLQYVDGVFWVDGVAVDNLSTSATIRLAVAVARKISKKAKVICIDGAEQLDPQTWEAFMAEIKDDGFTYFVTKVGSPHIDQSGVVVPMQKGQVLQ